MNDVRFTTFCTIYRGNLEAAVKERPADYTWKLDELPVVFERMCAAIKRGTMNKDSPAFRRTCKALKIKHTYKAIHAYLQGEDNYS